MIMDWRCSIRLKWDFQDRAAHFLPLPHLSLVFNFKIRRWYYRWHQLAYAFDTKLAPFSSNVLIFTAPHNAKSPLLLITHPKAKLPNPQHQPTRDHDCDKRPTSYSLLDNFVANSLNVIASRILQKVPGQQDVHIKLWPKFHEV